MENIIKYHAAVYVRLSKEDMNSGDSDKTESNSISNQKQLVLDYVKDKPEIDIVSIRVDDGYTGTNYDRPSFQRMMDDIKAGTVNCVIVKDLSRFGREYINAGKYIDRLFPYYGVRLIAINDGIDTITRDSSDGFNIILKNLMNDNYCRDISIKVRSQLKVKRKNGEFVGAFTPYGYRKKADDKNVLEIDEYAGAVVRDIFQWKIEGMNQDGIAKKLNDMGILSPLEYKRSEGIPYMNAFKTNDQAQWTAVAVRRILTNPVYIGTLVQGVHTRPNYKIKQVVVKPQEEWDVVPDAHESIIGVRTFELVQRLMELDTRTSPKELALSPMAGLVVCGDCGGPMVRKMTTDRGKKYEYYVCGNNRKDGSCSGHRIPKQELEAAVLALLQEHIRLVAEMNQCVHEIQAAPLHKIAVRKAEERMLRIEEDILHYQNLKASLYEDMHDGIISRSDFEDIRSQYDFRISEALVAKEQLQKEFDMSIENGNAPFGWMAEFLEYRNLQNLSRPIVVKCIEEIRVFEKKCIHVQFSNAECYEAFMAQLSEYYEQSQQIERKEVV